MGAATAFSDASQHRGGFIICKYGFSGFDFDERTLADAWRGKRTSIPYLEAVALRRCVDTALGHPDTLRRAQTHGLVIGIDSESVLWAQLAGNSKEPRLNDIILHIFLSCYRLDVWCELAFVRSACNPADAISRTHQDYICVRGEWLRPITPSRDGLVCSKTR